MNFLSFLNDFDNYEDRKVGKVEAENNNGIGVSTAYTSDEGYETALLDNNGTHPVERYETKEEAAKGHSRWVKFAKTANDKEVTKLGWSDLIDDETIILEADFGGNDE